MRTYEALYIVKPTLGDDEIQTVAQGVEKLVTDSGGAIVRSEVWGKRRLAYEVKGFQEGVYVLLRFQSASDFIKKLREYYRLAEDIIRHIVVFFDERTLNLESEQEVRNKVLMESRASGEGRGRDDDDDDDDDDDMPRRRPSRDRAPAPRPAPAPAPVASRKPAEPVAPAPETGASTDEPKTESEETADV